MIPSKSSILLPSIINELITDDRPAGHELLATIITLSRTCIFSCGVSSKYARPSLIN